MEFIDREKEIEALERLWERNGAQFLVLYGRRRTGKTTLLLHWAQDKPHVYWIATRTSAVSLLRSFSQALWNYCPSRKPGRRRLPNPPA